MHTMLRELDIVAQDVTAYGRDRRGAPRLPALLRALDGLGGRYWTRILYGYPSLVDDALLEAFASLKHLCRSIDIPVQHSHPDILRAMRASAQSAHCKGDARRDSRHCVVHGETLYQISRKFN